LRQDHGKTVRDRDAPHPPDKTPAAGDLKRVTKALSRNQPRKTAVPRESAKVAAAKAAATMAAPAKRPARSAARPKARARAADEVPFWKRKTLEQMTPAEWESLCDGCGRCCLNKLEEEDTGKLFFTDVACTLLDHGTCRCKHYKTRFKKVPDCVSLTPKEVRAINWLPPTCAYDLLAKGKDLYWWHPLVSGDPETVHTAGVSVRGKVGASEAEVPDEELENWIVKWPGQVPRGARASAAPSNAKERARAAAASVVKDARKTALVKSKAKT